MQGDQGRAMAAEAARWWLDAWGSAVPPELKTSAFIEHFYAAAVAEWERQESERPGSWPEDKPIKITFVRSPGFFLTIALCACGQPSLYVPEVDATMTLAATGYRVERWINDQRRYVEVERKGTL